MRRGSVSATSDPHVAAIGLPETAHRGLGGARVLRLRAFAAHVHHGELVARGGGAALHEAAHAAVLHRDITGRAHEIELLEPPAMHLGRVVGEAEVRPVQLHRVRTLGQDLADGQAVLDLLQDEVREHGQDLQLDPVAVLVHGVEQARIGKAIVLVLGADALIPVGRAHAVIGPVDGVAGVVAAVGADDDAAALGEARDAKGAEEGVEQAGVIRVLDVLDIELPVVGQDLHEPAEHAHGPMQHALDPSEDLLTEILRDGRRLWREAREDQPVQRGRAELARAVLLLAEGSGHTPAAVGALLEGDARQVAA